MCGIVGGVAQRNVVPILMEGLRRLEYRGYDSAGISVVGEEGLLSTCRAVGKVADLGAELERAPLAGQLGIAHTRWATHGPPVRKNAHPHTSGETVSVVHNGIVENHLELRESLESDGFAFASDTDTEVVAHLIHRHLQQPCGLLEAVRRTVTELRGAYALAVCSPAEPERLVVARSGSTLLVGLGIGENFVASDRAALLPVTQRLMHLEEGDVAELTREGVRVFDRRGETVERPVRESADSADAVEKGEYRHFMRKEIFEQPRALSETLEGRIGTQEVLDESFGHGAAQVFDAARAVHIVACGTSYHAGMIARYWIESLARVPCSVDLASEYRYRDAMVSPGTLFVTLSQSGETADTLAALRHASGLDYLASLAICNVAESSLVRESDLTLLTRAGPEIGVASTKAFTTQLLSLMLLSLSLGRRKGLDREEEQQRLELVRKLPAEVEAALDRDSAVRAAAEAFVERQHALFLGRGTLYPVAMEGALKLKEISYIHAEAYAAGELKHGPLALVDEDMPVVAVAPSGQLIGKLRSNLQEVRARGGELYLFADRSTGIEAGAGVTVIETPAVDPWLAPIVYTIPLQLLAYHVAVLKGTDVDQPRNLAKSVTVE